MPAVYVIMLYTDTLGLQINLYLDKSQWHIAGGPLMARRCVLAGMETL